MGRPPTIIDVAKACGFSKSTVSLALHGSLEIQESTKIAVRNAIEKLGYRHNRFARALRTRRSQVVGMLIQDHLNPFYAELVQYVEKRLRERGFDLIVTSSNTDLKLERQALERLFDHQVDGLIVSAIDYEKVAPVLQNFTKGGVHCVIAGPPAHPIPFDSVTIDLSDATMAAMEHLFELGHRKVAFLWGAPSFQGIGARFEVFKRALKKHKIAVPNEWVVHCGFRLRDGYEATKNLLLGGKERPTAIFALNDLLAIGATSAAWDLGLSLPRALSIIGVDNVEITSFMRPALTTVSQPIDLYSESLVNLVLDSDGRVKQTEARRITLTAELLIRESTGRAHQKPAG